MSVARVGLVLLLGALALLAGGCRRGRTRATAPIARDLRRYASAGVPGTRCTAVDQVVYVAPGVVQVRGCGQRRELVLSGPRAAPVPVQPIEVVAMHGLSCEAHALTIESPGPAVRAVSGCGRIARYDLHCGAGLCEWRMTAHAGRWSGMPADPADAPAWTADAWPIDPDVTSRGLTSGPSADELDLSSVALPPPPGASTAPQDASPPSDAPTPADEPIVPPPPS